MKRLGLIGGSSASATALLTDYLREETETRLGCGQAPELVTFSLNPQEVRRHLQDGAWPQLTARLTPAVQGMAAAGAKALILGSSVLQIVQPQLAESTPLPIFGMIDPVIDEARRHGVGCLALVGTRCRDEEEAWRAPLRQADIDLALPLGPDRAMVTTIIDEELAQGHCREPSQVDLMRLLIALVGQGAQGIVFTQPELSLLVDPSDCRMPVWSGLRLCARCVVDWAVTAGPARTEIS